MNDLKRDEIDVLDIKKNPKNDRFSVLFEVHGEHYNQSYPKRISHSFKYVDKMFEELDNGDRRFLNVLKTMYLDDSVVDMSDNDFSVDSEKISSRDEEFSKVCEDCMGKAKFKPEDESI